MPNLETAVKNKWKRYEDIIDSYYIADYHPQIRWKFMGNDKILQQLVYVKVKFTKSFWKYENFINEDTDHIWVDVPIEEE
jgi:hypothetical protein